MVFKLEDEDIQEHIEAFPDLPLFLSCLEENWSDVEEAFVARAPGRLDVMGGISDYSGGLVMQLPIKEACFAAVCIQPSSKCHITSFRQSNLISIWECSTESFNRLQSYEDCQEFFRSNEWVGYIAGCLIVLLLEGHLKIPLPGIRLLLWSTVPEGKGVASSACIEVASMKASMAALNIKMSDMKIAELCQRVENRVVGASCGIMDQMTAAMGQKSALMKLLCQPCQVLGHVCIPSHVMVVGIDSGDRHSISGSDYASVRIGAFMGRTILQRKTGRSLEFLAELTVEELKEMMGHLPDSMTGLEFLRKYGSHSDTETVIDPEHCYAVKQPTIHPILETHRVQEFCRHLEEAVSCDGVLLGQWMQASHVAYTNLGLDSPGTSELYNLTRNRVKEGIYGGKISGGGSGGTVCLLMSSECPEALDQLRVSYQSLRGSMELPIVFIGSSDGAQSFGIVHLKNGKGSLFKG